MQKIYKIAEVAIFFGLGPSFMVFGQVANVHKTLPDAHSNKRTINRTTVKRITARIRGAGKSVAQQPAKSIPPIDSELIWQQGMKKKFAAIDDELQAALAANTKKRDDDLAKIDQLTTPNQLKARRLRIMWALGLLFLVITAFLKRAWIVGHFRRIWNELKRRAMLDHNRTNDPINDKNDKEYYEVPGKKVPVMSFGGTGANHGFDLAKSLSGAGIVNSGLEITAFDTDALKLSDVRAACKRLGLGKVSTVCFGASVLGGRGAAADWREGAKAFMADRVKFEKMFKELDGDLVVIIGSDARGTGCMSSLYAAKLAKECGKIPILFYIRADREQEGLESDPEREQAVQAEITALYRAGVRVVSILNCLGIKKKVDVRDSYEKMRQPVVEMIGSIPKLISQRHSCFDVSELAHPYAGGGWMAVCTAEYKPGNSNSLVSAVSKLLEEHYCFVPEAPYAQIMCIEGSVISPEINAEISEHIDATIASYLKQHNGSLVHESAPRTTYTGKALEHYYVRRPGETNSLTLISFGPPCTDETWQNLLAGLSLKIADVDFPESASAFQETAAQEATQPKTPIENLPAKKSSRKKKNLRRRSLSRGAQPEKYAVPEAQIELSNEPQGSLEVVVPASAEATSAIVTAAAVQEQMPAPATEVEVIPEMFTLAPSEAEAPPPLPTDKTAAIAATSVPLDHKETALPAITCVSSGRTLLEKGAPPKNLEAFRTLVTKERFHTLESLIAAPNGITASSLEKMVLEHGDPGWFKKDFWGWRDSQPGAIILENAEELSMNKVCLSEAWKQLFYKEIVNFLNGRGNHFLKDPAREMAIRSSVRGMFGDDDLFQQIKLPDVNGNGSGKIGGLFETLSNAGRSLRSIVTMKSGE